MPLELIQPDWGAGRSRVLAGTTTRAGGASKPPYASLNLGVGSGDDPAAVAANRESLARRLGLAPVFPRQVHGTAVAEAGRLSPGTVADAVVTTRPDRACAILTADCLPILLCAADESWVAAIHAGWRGLAAGVVEGTLQRSPVPAEKLRAWLGPGISQANFEVGRKVLAAFARVRPEDRDCFAPNGRGRWQADLPRLARRRLHALGVEEVTGGDHCTYADPRFYSYRRDRQTGRMASFIMLRGAPSDRPSH